MHTPHQFLLICSPPFKEACFQAARKRYGSSFAFQWVRFHPSIAHRIPLFLRLNHPFSSFSGSHIENWHSILRNGLVNASYTKLQVELKSLQICTGGEYSGSKWQQSLIPSASWSRIWKRHLPESCFQYIVWILWYDSHLLHLCKYKGLLSPSRFLCVQRWVTAVTEWPPRRNSGGTGNQPTNRSRYLMADLWLVHQIPGLFFFLLCPLFLSQQQQQQQPCPPRFLYNRNLNCIALCEGLLVTMYTALT